VSSLYRCRVRVGYKPFRSEQIVLFDERQIQDISVKLKWEPNLSIYNGENMTPATGVNALSQSTCSVTFSDPYLTGIAWPALYDAASIYTVASVSAANGILLPPCEEGQDPVIDKCTKYVDIDQDSAIDPGDNFAILYISMWYNVAGTSFGSDYYFRVSGFSISHGTKYPSVTLKGTDARSIIFNQSLVNLSFDKGTEVEEAVKSIVELMGYEPQFCANTNEFPEKRRVIPKSLRFKGVTPDEAIKKLLNSTNGNSLSLPTQQWANKVSICARGEVQQGCSVFYLGRGLYEGYEISGSPQLSLVGKNAELGLGLNNADPYSTSAPFESQLYEIKDVVPNLRREALKEVKKVPFPRQFEPVSPHIQSSPRVNGFAWKSPRPPEGQGKKGVVVINEKLKDVNLFGIRPNGDVAISFLPGKVKEANIEQEQGRVLIDTKFGLIVCKPDDDKKCFARRIRQETSGLKEVKVKVNDELAVNAEIGSSTAEKPEFTRFFIEGHNDDQITLNPQIVWDWAVPQGNITEYINSLQGNNAPVSSTPLTSASETETRSSNALIGRIGGTGSSSGPHLHVETVPRGSGISETQLDTLVSKYISFPGKIRGRGYAGHGYPGIDYPADSGSPITLMNGASVAEVIETKCTIQNERYNRCGGGFGNHLVINTPDGVKILLAHLFPESIPQNITGLTATSGGGKGLPSLQSSPAAEGLLVETSFKGVPRSLRITPGRTILSFITDYDSWVENGGPRGNDNDTDPGVWIPRRFSNWFIKTCEYKWRDGDLRVNIEGVSQWGTTRTSVPTFTNYLEQMRKSGDIKSTNDYYGYIRSIGDLHWKAEDPKDGKLKDSTEFACPEAQAWAEAFSSGPDSTQPSATPGDVQGSYPASKCQYTGNKYPRDRVQKIINASYSAGLTSKIAQAAAVANALAESSERLDPAIRQRTDGTGGHGIFQWDDRRFNLFQFARERGKDWRDFNLQMEFYVAELTPGNKYFDSTANRKGNFIQRMNSARSPEEAAIIFDEDFERSAGVARDKRRSYAREIFNGLTCS